MIHTRCVMRVTLLAVCAALGSACATTGPLVPTADLPSPFTPRAQLEQLEQAAPTGALDFEQPAAVDEWTLLGPLPEQASHEPHPNASPFDAHLLQTVEGRVPSSADLACVARETAHFVAVKQGRPPAPLARYIAGRCGNTAARVETAWVDGKPEGSDEALAAAWAPKLDQLLLTLRPGSVVGTGFAREDGRAVWAIAWSKETLELADFAFAPKEGKVRVEGKAASDTLEVSATLSRGARGFTRCEADPQVPPPRFAFDCAADEGDAQAWLALSTRELDGVLGSLEARLLVLPKAGPASWRAPGGPAAAPTAAALLERLNALRAQSGLAPLKDAPAESKTLAALAPHYFAALRAGDTALRQQIALGAMAGWEVGEAISRGSVSVARAERADVSALLAELLEDPLARAELFDPEATLAALGTWASSDAAGALVSTYRLAPKVAPLDAVRQVVNDLNAGRLKRPRTKAVNWVVPQAQVSEDLQARLAEGRARPEEALDEMLQIATKQLKVTARGWHLERDSLTHIPFPVELLTEQPLDFWGVVLPYRARQHPWTQWALFFVALSGELKEVGPEDNP